MENARIAVTDFRKAYRQTIAVAGLTFHVEAGQVLGLLGPNGAGKTTTMRAIAGIIAPTAGSLFIDGQDVVANPIEAKRQLAYIPDEPRLFDSLTVAEHLDFTASAYGVANASEKAARLLEAFELEEKRNSLVQELSRGMRQKVAICCAYLHDPVAILFDEPLTGLDPRAIRTLKNSFRERSHEGAAIVISSHLLALVEDVCSHLLILDRGHARFFGPIADARTAFADMGCDRTLEEIFFRAVEGAMPTSPST